MEEVHCGRNEAYTTCKDAKGCEEDTSAYTGVLCTEASYYYSTKEEVPEAFLAGWRAKQKMADVRKQRGFQKDGEKSAGASSSHSRSRTADGKDPRKVNSRSDCMEANMPDAAKGHWRGDPECPLVQSGAKPKFVPKAKPKSGFLVNWIGMVNRQPREPEGDWAFKIVKWTVFGSLWQAEVVFPKKRMEEYIQERISSRMFLFFGKKYDKSMVEKCVYLRPSHHGFVVELCGSTKTSDIYQEQLEQMLDDVMGRSSEIRGVIM